MKVNQHVLRGYHWFAMVWRLMALVDAIPGYSCFGSESRFDEYQLARVEVYTSVSWQSRRLCEVMCKRKK